MERMPISYIPPNVNGNFVSAQATQAFQGSNLNPPGVDLPPINNVTYPPSFPANHPPMLQQNENSFPHPGGFLRAPPFTQPPGWPPHFSGPPPSFYGQPSHIFPGCPPPINAFPPPNQAFVGQQWAGIQSAPSDEMKRHASLETDDASWIQFWLRSRAKAPPPTKYPDSVGKKTIKVFEMKKVLQDSWTLLNELEFMEKELTSNIKECSEADWNSQLKDIESRKELFMEDFRAVEEADLKEFKKVLERRSKKRMREKRKRLEKKEVTAQRLENRKKLHLEIDIWLEKKKSEVELVKQEEAMKQEADAVLWDVRRKQSEGRKTLSLLSALVKLYQVRSKKKQESLPSEDSEQFTKIIDKLVQLWESQMKDYEMEEKTLREMLQESPQEKKDELRESMKRVEKCIREWKSALFGDKDNLPLDNAFVPFFLQPSLDMAALIETRSQWDQYISFSPSSSSIPIGWVIPKEPSSEEWKKTKRE